MVGIAEAYPPPVRAPKGAPNVLLILLDDVGFGMCSTFGGPVPTPHMEKLANNGLSYNRFHTTALCSPTRAALLTGRNHSAAGVHAPHHAPAEWRAKFAGKFDHGWDAQRKLTYDNQKHVGVIPADTKLTPRPKEIPAWDEQTADAQEEATKYNVFPLDSRMAERLDSRNRIAGERAQAGRTTETMRGYWNRSAQ
jgi:arylsulfatase A-like enzyme